MFEIFTPDNTNHNLTKTKWLNKYLGGTWKYANYRTWNCNDGRTVRYTAPSLDEFDNPVGPSQCWLDTPGKPTVPFNFMYRK